MIAFKYTKTDGAEYLSHLDLLRHVYRTMRRAGMEIKTSGGFHPHPKIYLNNPLGLGIKSVAEYCAADISFDGNFEKAFNANSPAGVRCLAFKEVDENPNFAYTINACTYSVEGIDEFDESGLLSRKEIVICDKRGRTLDIRPRIYSLERKDGKLFFTLGCGENNLRPDLFTEFIESEYGKKLHGLIKISAHGKSVF